MKRSIVPSLLMSYAYRLSFAVMTGRTGAKRPAWRY